MATPRSFTRWQPEIPKRRVFISYDHDDAQQVNGFLGCRELLDNLEFYNHKLDERIQSDDPLSVMRVIREEYISPASVTVVLIGERTAESTWVQWEIDESLKRGKGLLGIYLKGSMGPIPRGLPANAVGQWMPEHFCSWIEWAWQNRDTTAGPYRRTVYGLVRRT